MPSKGTFFSFLKVYHGIIKNMRNSRQRFFGSFGSFFGIMILFSIFGDLVGDFFSILFGMGAIGAMFYGFFSLFKGLSIPEPNQTLHSQKKNISNRDKMRIDNKLTNYFKNNYSLPVYGDIYLTTNKGVYTNVENLVIAYGKEKILSMDEFYNYYPAMYNRMVDLLVAFSKADDQAFAAEVKTPEIKKEEILSDAQKYIDKINSLNTNIPNEEITKGLYQTCAYLKKIDLVEKKKDESKLTKLYDYYLPILTNILENYDRLKNVDDNSKEFKEAEAQLIKTIILINEALKTINEQLHEEDYMNLSADITTLQSLLKKDGLVDENPFQGGAE